MKTFFIALLLVCMQAVAQQQAEHDSILIRPDTSAFSPLKFSLVAGTTAGIITLAHFQNYNSWWKGERSPFHLGEDGTQYLHADKLGHVYFTYVTSDGISRSLMWAGIPASSAFLYGGSIALAFQLYVEVEDGFHPDLGFSAGDAIADISGAALPYLQNRYALIRPISLKWSALTSNRYREGAFRTFIDDYESQYYWLSVNIKEALGSATPDYIPDFLNIALGYGVKHLDADKTPEIYLSLDCDMRKLPGDGAFLTAIKHVANYLHFPAPTLRITPEITLYGIRF